MKPFKEWINEVFTRDYGTKVRMERPEFGARNCRFEFSVESVVYTMDVSKMEQPFTRLADGIEVHLNIWEPAFSAYLGRYSSVDITGTGNSMLVFQAVMDCLKEFYNHYATNIDGITFSASEISRRLLYLKLAQRFGPQYNMSIVKTPTSHEGEGGFILVKNELINKFDFTQFKTTNANHLKQLRHGKPAVA